MKKPNIFLGSFLGIFRGTFLAAFLAIFLIFGAGMATAKSKKVQESTNKTETVYKEHYLDKLNGHTWQASSQEERKSFITGLSSGVAIDYAIMTKYQQKNAKTKYHISKFERAWIEVFADQNPEQISAKIDDYYKAHPDKLDTNVLFVLWYELMAPNYKGA